MFRLVFCATAMVAMLLPPQANAAPLSLRAALAQAAQRSEATRAAHAGVLSASEAAQAAAQLPDPMLRVGIENLPVTGPDRFSTTREAMTMKKVGISQEWLSRDKRDARRSAAEAVVGRETVQPRIAAAEARLQTALAFVDAFYAAEAVALTRQMEHHAHEELEAARARVASATGGSEEVLKLTASRGMFEDESAELRQQQTAAKIALQRWVGVAVDELEPIGPLPALSEGEYVFGDPTVVALQKDVDVARGAAAVAASNRQPNWTWEIAYGQRTGYSDLVTVGVTIPLPVAPAARQDRDTAARVALVDKTEADLAEATRAAAAEYLSLTSEVGRLRERIERYRSAVLAPAQQRTTVATAAYRSNQASLATLFEARHAEVEAERKVLALQRELTKRQAQLAYRPVAPGVEP